ncbi:MAG TPA: lanthionine synthetase LanC family protein, partial [Dermatophilaceae bacterium]|nr:lanthionine synthetase LanC family protein [Dermatophilaceae bacterium]
MTRGEAFRELGEAAWRFVHGQIRYDGVGPWLPETVPADGRPPPGRDDLYAGIAGLAPLLAELRLHRGWTPGEQDLAAAVVVSLRTGASTNAALYDGLAGSVVALRMLDADPGALLRRIAELAVEDGWPATEGRWTGTVINDVVMGTAGTVLAAAWAGGDAATAVARHGADGLLATARTTASGLDWLMDPAATRRMPNFSHGTAGVATALAIASTALDDRRYLDAAVAGARDLLAVGDLSTGGFTVPVLIPHGDADAEPVTYSWCHGPTGTSYLFAALARAGVPEVGGHTPAELRRACLQAVMGSGVPQRLRPGFWDNDGRCCGTAGVGEAVLDAFQTAAADDPGDPYAARLLEFATHLGDVLAERAVADGDARCWRFVEHRN